jgi:hypothetical protein
MPRKTRTRRVKRARRARRIKGSRKVRTYYRGGGGEGEPKPSLFGKLIQRAHEVAPDFARQVQDAATKAQERLQEVREKVGDVATKTQGLLSKPA